MPRAISSKFVENLFDLSRQQLSYWRKVGLFSAAERTDGNHYRYGFQDLVALKTIRTLQEKGFTTYQIRKSFQALKERFPNISNAFVEKPVLVLGRRIAIVDKGKAYDALSGQTFLIDLSQIESWVEALKDKEPKLTFEVPLTRRKKKRAQ
jgi:DNA-binding transcriptional MerR regulator